MAKPHTTKPWTTGGQRALLRLVDLGRSDPEIATAFGRSCNSVTCKRHELGRFRRKMRGPIQLVNALDRWIALPWLEARLAPQCGTISNAPIAPRREPCSRIGPAGEPA